MLELVKVAVCLGLADFADVHQSESKIKIDLNFIEIIWVLCDTFLEHRRTTSKKNYECHSIPHRWYDENKKLYLFDYPSWLRMLSLCHLWVHSSLMIFQRKRCELGIADFTSKLSESMKFHMSFWKIGKREVAQLNRKKCRLHLLRLKVEVCPQSLHWCGDPLGGFDFVKEFFFVFIRILLVMIWNKMKFYKYWR